MTWAGRASGGGRWSFRDDRGRTVSLDQAPETLVALDRAVETLRAAAAANKALKVTAKTGDNDQFFWEFLSA